MRKKIGKVIEDVIYVLLLAPLVLITIRITYQTIFFKDTIPDIFGYKMFVIFDENMDDSLKYGDLAITYNKNTEDIQKNDVVAYRNRANTITIHKVLEMLQFQLQNGL